ncbi:MAG: F0F1 ATP synthase subunit A [Terriglobia bacterium]|jgi:F-type H+-transporting ATPase subunit a
MEHELWFTTILNKLIGGIVSKTLTVAGIPIADPTRPIPNYIAMEVFVIFLIMAGVLLLRQRLSIEKPGSFQQAVEVAFEFSQNLAEQIIGHEGKKHVTMLGNLGIFIVLCNLLGLIPSFQTPTAQIQVTLGCAVSVFIYYNVAGIRRHGLLGYLKTFCGPIMWIAVIMLPVEIISNLARLLSLSVRLYANMFAGELLEKIFTGLVPIFIPAIVMGLHAFVSIIQTYIFMLLPAVYISMAVSEEH